MYERVIFFNHGHLGDTFLAKPVICEARKIVPAKKYGIANGYPAEYVLDIVDEHYDLASFGWKNVLRPDIVACVDTNTNTCFINTWWPFCFTKEVLTSNRPYAQDDVSYNFDVYVTYMNLTLKHIDQSYDIKYMLDNKSDYILPGYDVDIPFIKIKNFNKSYGKNRVLIFNQQAFSGQSDNVDTDAYIQNLLEDHDNIFVYTSMPTRYQNDRLVCLHDIFKLPDLLHIAMFSTQCDFICGPGNAPLISTWIQPNINNTQTSYITINRNDQGEAKFFYEQQCRMKVVSTTADMFAELNNQLNQQVAN